MKRILFTIATLITSISFAQDNIWVSIPNYESKRSEVNQTLSQFNITEIKQALPSSKNRELQDVYQITCNCDVNDLLQVAARNGRTFIKPEIGPKYETLQTPNDYSIYGYDYALNSINATGAWEFTQGDTSIVIAITDANYYVYHEELAMKVNWISQNNYNTNYGHGTAVAALAAGNTNNGAGKSSIGWNSHLQLRKMEYNEILEATYSGAKVINCSWASGCYSSSYAQAVIDEAYNNGSVIVASAGNGTTCGGASNLVYPASYNNVISVSSVGPQDNHERFVGNPSFTHQHNSEVDLVAPGYDVLLTTAPGQYMTGTGTSFASPMVSGTVALMLAVNKCLTPTQIEWILKESADTTIYNYNQNYIGLLGRGKLNSQKAVEMAKKFNTIDANLEDKVVCEVAKRQLSVNLLSGQAPYTYNWSTGENSEKIFVDSSQMYSVEVRDSKGCSFFAESNFTTYNDVQVQADIQHVSCEGMDNGSISLQVTGGDGNINYEWSNTDTAYMVTDLKEGVYLVDVFDESGCKKTEEFLITEPEQLITNISYVQPTQNSTGSIEITTQGGTSPYTYEWNNGESSDILFDVTAGFYEVLVTDANGCMSSENVMLETLVEETNSISENNIDAVEVYPNPSNGPVNVKLNKDVEAKIFDTTGKLVKTITNSDVISLEVAGVYYITYENNTKKIIIK